MLSVITKVLVCCFLCFTTCTKERYIPSASLSFRFDDKTSDVEWNDVVGSRYANTGNCYITANGADEEQFYLELEHIFSTGPVQNVTSKNISYSNIYGFKTGSLQSIQIKVLDLSEYRIRGTFKVAFINAVDPTDVIYANGEFAISGQE